MNRSLGTASAKGRPGWHWVSSCLLALGLAGCNANRAEIAARAPAAVHVAARPGVSPRGAPVALASVEGAPAAVVQRFAQQTRDRAAGLDVVMTDGRDARYLVRGYLSAQPLPEGTVVSYVLDVFDARKARVQRVADALTVKGAAEESWAGVDDKALGELASKCAADLAAVLSNMPEAVAASKSGPGPQSGGGAPQRGPADRLATAALR